MRGLLALVALLCSLLVSTTAWAEDELVVGVLGSETYDQLNALAESGLFKGINVKLTDMKMYDLYASLLAKTGPDVIVADSNTVRMFSDYSLVKPLDDVISKNPELKSSLERVFPGVRSSAYWFGSLIGVPFTTDVVGFLYNPDRLAAIGVDTSPNWDWDGFAAVGKKLSVYSDDAKREAGLAIPLGSYSLPFLWSNGGGFVSSDLTSCTIGRPESKAALLWLKDMYTSGSGSIQTTSLTSFYRNQITMGVGSNFYQRTKPLLPRQYRDSAPDSLEILPYPKAPQTGESVSPILPVLMAVNEDTHNLNGSLEFLSNALSKTVQTALLIDGPLPVRSDVQFSADSRRPSSEAFRSMATSGRDYVRVFADDKPLLQDYQEGLLHFLNGEISLEEFIIRVDGPTTQALEVASRDTKYRWSEPTPPPKREPPPEGPAEPTSQRPPTPADALKTKIKVYASYSFLYPIADAFNAQSRDVWLEVVNAEATVSQEERAELLTSADLVINASPAWAREAMVDLDQFLRRDRLSFNPSNLRILSQAREPEGLFALPLARDPFVVLAYKDSLEKAGLSTNISTWTWDEFQRYALQLAKKADDDNALFVGSSGFFSVPASLQPKKGRGAAIETNSTWTLPFLQKGGDPLAGPYDELRSGLDMVKIINEKGANASPTGGTIFPFRNGEAKMALVRHSSVLSILSPFFKLADHGILLLPLPEAAYGARTSSGNFSATVSISKTGQHQREAWSVVKWLSTPEGATALAKTGNLPALFYPEIRPYLEQLYGDNAYDVFNRDYIKYQVLPPEMRNLATEYLLGKKTWAEFQAEASKVNN